MISITSIINRMPDNDKRELIKSMQEALKYIRIKKLKESMNHMNTYLCKEAKEIINKVASDIISIDDNTYYLWLYNHDGDMIGIVHGGENKPFELKIINIGEYKQKDFQFHNWCDFKDFLQNEMRDYIIAMAL